MPTPRPAWRPTRRWSPSSTDRLSDQRWPRALSGVPGWGVSLPSGGFGDARTARLDRRRLARRRALDRCARAASPGRPGPTERGGDPRRRSRLLRPRRVWRRDRHAAPRSAGAGGLEVHPGHEHGPLLAEPGGAPHRLLSAGDWSRCAAGRRRPRGASRRGPGNASPVGPAPSRVPESRGLPHLPLGQMACRRIAAGAGI